MVFVSTFCPAVEKMSDEEPTNIRKGVCIKDFLSMFDVTTDIGDTIQTDYVNRFVITNKTFTDNRQYVYYYGGKKDWSMGTATIVYRVCADYPTKYGIGVTEGILTTYNNEGDLVDQKIVCKQDGGNKIKLRFSKWSEDSDCPMVSIDDSAMVKIINDSICGVRITHSYGIYTNNKIYKERHRIDRYFPLFDKNELLRENSGVIQYYPIDIQALDDAYAMLMTEPENERQQMNYFRAFPDNWSDLTNTYGYRADKNFDASMFYKYDKHINAFCDLYWKNTAVPDSLFIDKMLDIVYGGRPDNSSYHIWNMMKGFFNGALAHDKRSGLIYKTLATLTPAHQFDFWRFMFSKPCEY